jgi:hypothetical protein
MLTPALTASVGNILVLGLGVFTLLSGLKNTPFFADFFEKWPSLAVIINAAASLFAAWMICIKSGGFEFFTCTLTALGVFLAAAGIHLVKKSLSPPPRDTPEIRADTSRGHA